MGFLKQFLDCQGLQCGMRVLSLLIHLGYYILASYGLFLLVIWWVDDDPVIWFGKGALEPTTIKAGETLKIQQEVRKYRDCPGTVYRYLMGDCGIFPVMQGETVLPEGFNGVLHIATTIPVSAQSGICRFEAHHHYYCNPMDWLFNRRNYEPDPLEFRVLVN